MAKITAMRGNDQGMFAMNAGARRSETESRTERNAGKKKGNAVFAGDLNMEQDSILAKKQKAQREALKMLKDVFKEDLRSDEEQKARELHVEDMKQENEELKSQLKDIEEMRKNLAEQYGETPDSEEQQKMERMLDAAKEDIEGRMADNQKNITMETDTIKDTDMARLKKHPMKDAAMDAKKHLETARKEMIGSLYDEAREHIDEKTEEAKKEQKEKSEEKKQEEKEEAIRKAKEIERELLIQKGQENAQERISEQTAKEKARSQVSLQNQIDGDVLDSIHDGVKSTTEVEQEIKDLLEKMRLLQEDLKGAAVDDLA